MANANVKHTNAGYQRTSEFDLSAQKGSAKNSTGEKEDEKSTIKKIQSHNIEADIKKKTENIVNGLYFIG